LLDEIVFKRQRFFVVVDLYEVNVAGFGNQTSGFCFRQPVFIEIAPDAAAKVFRFANVENLSFCVLVEVNAGLGGKLRNFLAKFHPDLSSRAQRAPNALCALGSYNSIVTCKLRLACLLVVASAIASFSPAQSSQNAQKQQPPVTQQPPDETNPPEEDASVAPKVYAFDPLEAQRCIGIGNFYMHKGSKGYRAALGRYEDATKYDPNSAEAFFKVGEVEEKLNNKDAAKIAFQKVVKLAPDSKFAKDARKKLASLT
jgi:tetratricopeptide (TPR) repeat protein